MNESARIIRRPRRIGANRLPMDFSRDGILPAPWRWMAAACLAISVLPIAATLPLGWAFCLAISMVCAVGAMKPQRLWGRLCLMGLQVAAILWWLGQGYPQSPMHVAMAVFALGVPFKSIELRTIGDAYAASVLVMLGPFMAISQSLPVWSVVGCIAAVPMGLALRSGLSALESGSPAGKPWSFMHWGALLGLLVVAVPMAILFFVLTPRLSSPWISGNQMARTGMSERMEPGSMDALMEDPSMALFIEFQDGQIPARSDLYWRASTLSMFDGRTWSPVPVPEELEGTPVPSRDGIYRYSIQVFPQRSRMVPFLDRPLSSSGSGLARTYSLSHVSNAHPYQIRHYVGQSDPSARWDQDALHGRMREINLALPDQSNPRTRELVARWQAQGRQGRDLVNAALAYFKDNMTYTYTPALLGRHGVDDLLFKTQEGYCEHFSSAFAFMLRAGGVPARVVTGYQGGSPGGRENEWAVRQLDAHAWVEAWLPQEGWVRIDPTSAVVAIRPAPPGSRRWSMPLAGYAWMARMEQASTLLRLDGASRGKTSQQPRWLSLALPLVAVAIALVVGLALMFWRPIQEKREPQVRQFARLRAKVEAWTGLTPAATPRQLAQASRSVLTPESMRELDAIVARWEAWRYGQVADPGLARDIARVRRKLRRGDVGEAAGLC